MSDNPYPGLASLRAQAPVHRIDEHTWMVLTYREAAKVLRDATNFRSGPLGQQLVAGLPEGAAREYLLHRINFLDPPEHTRVRSAVDQWFTLPRVNALRPEIVALSNQLVDAMGQVVDLVPALAHPLPSLVICQLLGAAEPEELGDWGEKVAMLLSPAPTAQQLEQGVAGAAHFADWVNSLDMSAIALCESERRSLVMTLFAAGHHTTRDLFTNGMTALLRHPEQLEAARENPSLAVEEFLRYDTPTQIVFRVAAPQAEIAGQAIPEGDMIIVGLGAANRDPARFEEPDRFDVTRRKSLPLSFAPGPHTCLGAPLARMEVAIMLETLLDRFPNMTIQDPGDAVPRRPSMTFHGLTRLVVCTSVKQSGLQT